MSKKLSIIVPVYNEVETVLILLNKLIKLNLYNNFTSEIIIIDDGSYDQTASILKRLSEQYTSLKIKTNSVNLGIGKSLLKGLFICFPFLLR